MRRDGQEVLEHDVAQNEQRVAIRAEALDHRWLGGVRRRMGMQFRHRELDGWR